MSLTKQMSELALQSKRASRLLTRMSTNDKNACLMAMADVLIDNANSIKEANELLDVLVLHRVGVITPGEEIVLVCCWSSHRKAAFDSCRAIMEALKSKAPFWKKETLNDGERWVARNTPG